MLRTLSLRVRIVFMVVGLLAGIFLLACLGGVGIGSLRKASLELHDQGFGPAERTMAMHGHLLRLRGDIYKLLLMPEERETVGKHIETDLRRVDSSVASLVEIAPTLPDSMRQAIGELQGVTAAYLEAARAIRSHAEQGDAAFGIESMKTGDATKARKKVDAVAERLLGLVDRQVAEIDARASALGARLSLLLWSMAVVLLGLGSLGAFLLARQILRPIAAMVSQLDRLGEGDFRAFAIEGSETEEIRRMIDGVGRLRSRLSESFGAVATSAESVLASSHAQTEMTTTLIQAADDNQKEVEASVQASQSVSASFAAVEHGSATAKDRLESVSAAVEEMSASVAEIARSTEQTRATTLSAMEGANTAAARMDELAEAARQIDTVVEMIVEISEQTKLLALNATIEAARAGEAGKGFAVVASEVKELAKGTADATEDIRKRVEAIRSSTKGAVAEITTVARGMGGLGQSISSIASAVEQQSVTMQEIARAIGETVHETRSTHADLASGSKAMEQIAQELRSLQQRGQVLRDIAELAQTLSGQAAEVSQGLGGQLRKFRLH